ncbi:MAG: M28 family peptidase [Candidatus Brocadiae bacterium]|nr:M28 family peptidase [Candidatus Brocadiia bacterium]
MQAEKDRLWEHEKHLCEEIGPRLSGTPADERTVEYIGEHFRRCGAEVEVQDYACPGWDHEGTELTLLGEEGPEALPAFAQTFTEGCELEAELAAVGTRHELEFRPDLEGKVLLLDGEVKGPLAMNRNQDLLAIEERRPAAAIIADLREEVSSKLLRDPFLRVPAVAVAPSVAARLRKGEGRRVRLRISARRYDSTSHNVIGHLPGSEAGRIVVGAHYDTAAESPGAADDAGGTAVVMELCETFAAAGRRRLGIDFIAFGAEEYGRHLRALGSVEYVRRHRAETLQTQAAIQADGVGVAGARLRAHVMGWHPARTEQILRLLGRFPGCTADERQALGSDHVPFYVHNIPAILFGSAGRRIPIHSAADTIDLMGADELAAAADVMGAVIKHLAGVE